MVVKYSMYPSGRNCLLRLELVPVNCIYVPGGLGSCPLLGGGSVVVDSLLIFTPVVRFCNVSMFCCALLYVHSSFAIVLMGKRELVALLSLSSWCLVMVVWLFLAVSLDCLQFVMIILTIFDFYEVDRDISCVHLRRCSQVGIMKTRHKTVYDHVK